MTRHIILGFLVLSLLAGCAEGISDVDELLVEACGIIKFDGFNTVDSERSGKKSDQSGTKTEKWILPIESKSTWHVADSIASLRKRSSHWKTKVEAGAAASQIDSSYVAFSTSLTAMLAIVQRVVAIREGLGTSIIEEARAHLYADWSFTNSFNDHLATYRATCSGVKRRLNS